VDWLGCKEINKGAKDARVGVVEMPLMFNRMRMLRRMMMMMMTVRESRARKL
jgi:hypothetical protein